MKAIRVHEFGGPEVLHAIEIPDPAPSWGEVAIHVEVAGVNRQQLAARGFGERYPVASNTNPDGTDNPSGRAKNRRVELNRTN